MILLFPIFCTYCHEKLIFWYFFNHLPFLLSLSLSFFPSFFFILFLPLIWTSFYDNSPLVFLPFLISCLHYPPRCLSLTSDLPSSFFPSFASNLLCFRKNVWYLFPFYFPFSFFFYLFSFFLSVFVFLSFFLSFSSFFSCSSFFLFFLLFLSFFLFFFIFFSFFFFFKGRGRKRGAPLRRGALCLSI